MWTNTLWGLEHSLQSCHANRKEICVMYVISTQILLMIWTTIWCPSMANWLMVWLTILASQTKLGSFSFPCELCDYDRDMAGQIKKHVESMHIDLVHTFRAATKREHTFVFRLHISQHRGVAHDDVRRVCQICGCVATIETNFSVSWPVIRSGFLDSQEAWIIPIGSKHL